MSKKTIVLLSGGLDSATCLAIAKEEGYECHALSFDYGQRSQTELNAAKKVCAALNIQQHYILPLPIHQYGGSALTDKNLTIPNSPSDDIPITYVPARNTIFLSFALGLAEVSGANAIFIGANIIDYSNYPDCRPEYLEAFTKMANLATRAGVTGEAISIQAPLLYLTKAQIIQKAHELKLDLSLTVSCYDADEQGQACGQCDSCRLRAKGFIDANLPDVTLYKN